MVLLPYTVTALSTTDGAGGRNIVVGAEITVSNNAGAVNMYDDAEANGEALFKYTASNGQCVIWIEAGVYTLTVDGSITAFSIGGAENLSFISYASDALVVDGTSAGNHYYITNPAGCEITVNESAVDALGVQGVYISFTSATNGYVRFVEGTGFSGVNNDVVEAVTVNSPYGLDFSAKFATASLMSSDRYVWNASGALD